MLDRAKRLPAVQGKIDLPNAMVRVDHMLLDPVNSQKAERLNIEVELGRLNRAHRLRRLEAVAR